MRLRLLQQLPQEASWASGHPVLAQPSLATPTEATCRDLLEQALHHLHPASPAAVLQTPHVQVKFYAEAPQVQADNCLDAWQVQHPSLLTASGFGYNHTQRQLAGQVQDMASLTASWFASNHGHRRTVMCGTGQSGGGSALLLSMASMSDHYNHQQVLSLSWIAAKWLLHAPCTRAYCTSSCK